MLIDSLGDLDLRGKRFLDMGTGSDPSPQCGRPGGALVTACDINPRAVALAAQNLRRNQLRGEVVESDLFSALADTQFDVICFNIPFYRGQPADHFEAAFFGGPNLETVATFAAGCGRHLASAGVVVIVYRRIRTTTGSSRCSTRPGSRPSWSESAGNSLKSSTSCGSATVRPSMPRARLRTDPPWVKPPAGTRRGVS